jgi:hypothetical protein
MLVEKLHARNPGFALVSIAANAENRAATLFKPEYRQSPLVLRNRFL